MSEMCLIKESHESMAVKSEIGNVLKRFLRVSSRERQ